MPLRPTLSCYDQRLFERLSLVRRCTAYPDDVSVWFGRLSDIDRAAGTPSQSQVLVTSHNSPSLETNYYFSTQFYSTRDMSTTPEPSVFESLFQSALKEYEIQTEINLVRHPIAAQLDHCNTVESILEVLQGQARAFREFPRGDNEVVALLKQTVHILHKLSITIVLVESLDLVCLSC